jgi:hypothetical protein
LKTKSSRQNDSSRSKTTTPALSDFVLSLFLVLLIWLFAELIFLPLSKESFTGDLARRVTSIVATAFVIAVGYLLPQTVRRGSVAVKLLSNLLVKSRYPKDRQAKMQLIYESVGRALLYAILGIIVSSLLYWIHPVFGGMALLATIVTTFIFLFQGASQASDEILQKMEHQRKSP